MQGLIYAASTKNMVNHAKSNALKAQLARKKQDDLMAQAVALFHAQKMDSDTGKPGIQSGIGVTERVIGPAGAKMQHQQRSGNRKNITVLPTICADGTSLPPTVIYKGEAFQTKWLQENPLDAR